MKRTHVQCARSRQEQLRTCNPANAPNTAHGSDVHL